MNNHPLLSKTDETETHNFYRFEEKQDGVSFNLWIPKSCPHEIKWAFGYLHETFDVYNWDTHDASLLPTYFQDIFNELKKEQH